MKFKYIFLFLFAGILTACIASYKPIIVNSTSTLVPQIMETATTHINLVPTTLTNSNPLNTPTITSLDIEKSTETIVFPTPIGSIPYSENDSPTERLSKMLKVFQEDSLYYQDLINDCTRNYIAGQPYYEFSLGSASGYYLPFYNNKELCSIAFFSIQNESLKIERLISAGYKSNSQINEIAKAVFNDPYIFLDLMNQCTKDFKIGTQVYVQYLDSPSGYYIQPFFNPKGLCYAAAYLFQNGEWKFQGSFGYNAGINGDKYPQATSEEVIRYIEKMTCQKVIGVPQYADILSSYGPRGPFWKVSTSDGETYYVIGIVGPTDTDPTPILQIHGWNAKDDFRVWLEEQKNCQTGK